MGAGNTIIRTKDGISALNTYYIEINEMFDNPDDIWEELKLDIQNIKLKNSTLKNEHYSDLSNTYLVLVETKVMRIIISNNETDMAIACLLIEDVEHGRCMNTAFKKQANYFMRKLNELFELSVRTSAWTSGKVEKDVREFY